MVLGSNGNLVIIFKRVLWVGVFFVSWFCCCCCTTSLSVGGYEYRVMMAQRESRLLEKIPLSSTKFHLSGVGV